MAIPQPSAVLQFLFCLFPGPLSLSTFIFVMITTKMISLFPSPPRVPPPPGLGKQENPGGRLHGPLATCASHGTPWTCVHVHVSEAFNTNAFRDEGTVLEGAEAASVLP